MKTFVKTLACTALLLNAALVHAAPPNARLQLPDFSSLEKAAAEVVTVQLDPTLLGMATAFLDPGKPEDAAAKEIIAGIAGIYVHSFTFDEDFAYPTADVERVRKQLSASFWQKLVEVRNRKEGSQVDIRVCVDAGKPCGLAIISSEPREFTVVNIVGAIDLAKLRQLEGKFGIPHLPEDETPEKPKR